MDYVLAEGLYLPTKHLGHQPLAVFHPTPAGSRAELWGLTMLRVWGSGPRRSQGCGSYSKAARLRESWRKLRVDRTPKSPPLPPDPFLS